MARPGRRPWPGHHHGHGGNGGSQGQGNKWSVFRLPDHIRLPLQLAKKLEQPRPTFTAKKILDGKYVIISPALIFKLKAGDTDGSTTAIPETSTANPTTEEPEIEETTTDEPEIEETTTPESEEEETTTPTPSFFKKRSFSIDDNEQLLFLDD